MSGPFERFIGVDWSGAASASAQRIFVAEVRRRDTRLTVQSVIRARDREAVADYLECRPLTPARAWSDWPRPHPIDGRSRRLVALDFAFGFPAAFQHPDHGAEWAWEDLGRWATELVGEGQGNGRDASVRRSLAADPRLRRQFRMTGGERTLMHMRLTDEALRPLRPASVFHLVGPSQVGTGSITGIAMLARLRKADGLAIWPFDPEERLKSAAVVLVEIYPRMWLRPGLQKNELPERVAQLEQWERDGVAFHPKAELAASSSGDALDAVAAAIGAARSCHLLPRPERVPEGSRAREGWIAGVQVPG